MSVVQTPNGAIDNSSEMGYTLSHEHIFVHDERLVPIFQAYGMKRLSFKVTGKIIQAYEAGVRTIWMHLFLETEEMLRF